MVESHTRLSMISGVNVRYFMLFLMLASLNVYLSLVPHLGILAALSALRWGRFMMSRSPGPGR
jgi:hypothetical protein